MPGALTPTSDPNKDTKRVWYGLLGNHRRNNPKCDKKMKQMQTDARKKRPGVKKVDWGLPNTRVICRTRVECLSEVPEQARAFTCPKCGKHLPWIPGEARGVKRYNHTERISILQHGKRGCPWRGSLLVWQYKQEREKSLVVGGGGKVAKEAQTKRLLDDRDQRMRDLRKKFGKKGAAVSRRACKALGSTDLIFNRAAKPSS